MKIIRSWAETAEESQDGYEDARIYTHHRPLSDRHEPCISVVGDAFDRHYAEALNGREHPVTDIYPPQSMVRVSTQNEDADIGLQIATPQGILSVLLDGPTAAAIAAQLLAAHEIVMTPKP